MVTADMKLKDACSLKTNKQTNKQTKTTLAPWKKTYDQPRQSLKTETLKTETLLCQQASV